MNSSRSAGAQCCAVAVSALCCFSAQAAVEPPDTEAAKLSWPMYNLNYAGTRYVGLNSINTTNVEGSTDPEQLKKNTFA